MCKLLFDLTLIAFACAAAPLIVEPGYGQYAINGGIQTEYFFMDGFSGGMVVERTVHLSGASVPPVTGAKTNVALNMPLYNTPLVVLYAGVNPGCCGLTLRFPTGITLEPSEVGSLEVEFVDMHLTGSMTVDVAGVLQIWDVDARLSQPTTTFLHTVGIDNRTAVVMPGVNLLLDFQFTERGGTGRQTRIGELSAADNFGSLTTVPEPGSAALALLGVGALLLGSRISRSKRVPAESSHPRTGPA